MGSFPSVRFTETQRFSEMRMQPARHEGWWVLPTKGSFIDIIIAGSFERGAFDSAKNHKRKCRKRQSVTAKREKSQTPKFV